jgi:hypothetical protein
MESTGVYWKPIWNLLEDEFTLLLVNARHIKTVPGRKTDVKDCEWLADLLRHGLLRASFVPDRPQRELRELTRYRTALVRERTAESNRLHKTLEGANLKLSSVASKLLSLSGRQMLARCWRARPTRPCWPTWPRGGCGPSCPNWSGRWRAVLGGTSTSCSPGNWRTSTFWTRRSSR